MNSFVLCLCLHGEIMRLFVYFPGGGRFDIRFMALDLCHQLLITLIRRTWR